MRRAARSADPDEPEHQIPITSAEFGLDWDAARRTLRVPFKVTAGAARFTLALRVCRARAARRQLDVRARRRMGRARSADRRRRGAGAQARGDARQHRSGPAAHHAGAGRPGHQGARRRWRRRRHRRDVRQVRLRRRAAPRARNCLQSDVGRRVQAAVAGFHLAQGSRLGGRSTSSAATSNASTSRPMPRSRRCSRAARRCPRRACRSRSSAAPRRFARWRDCRRSAMPT